MRKAPDILTPGLYFRPANAETMNMDQISAVQDALTDIAFTLAQLCRAEATPSGVHEAANFMNQLKVETLLRLENGTKMNEAIAWPPAKSLLPNIIRTIQQDGFTEEAETIQTALDRLVELMA